MGSYQSKLAGNYRLDLTEGYLTSEDHQMLILLLEPAVNPEDVPFCIEFHEFLKLKIAQAGQVFTEEEELEFHDILKVDATGAHVITARENDLIRADVISMFLSSFTLVLLLFILAYRRPMALLFVGLPLLTAELWTLGFGYLLFGRLNLLTSTFSAVIVGLGIDYAIHLFSRYLDERANHHGPLQAMEISLSETGVGTLTGGLTTALAFLAMAFTEFTGLREFAILAALGIGMCLLQMFVFLPSLLFARERFRVKRRVHRPQWDFAMKPFLQFVFSHPKGLLTVIALGSVVMLYEASTLRFNSDIRSIRAKSNHAITLQNEVTGKLGGSLRSLTFVLNAPSEKDLFALHQGLKVELDQQLADGLITRYDSILNFFQEPQAQQANLEALKSAGIQSEQVKTAFLEAHEDVGFNLTKEALSYIDNLTLGLSDPEPLTLTSLLESERGGFLRQFIAKEGDHLKAIVNVYPSLGLWNRQSTDQIVNRVFAVLPQEGEAFGFLTGIRSLSYEIRRLVHDSFIETTLLATLLVALTLWFHFRRVSLLILTLLPLGISVLWMLGTMSLLGVDINMLNFVATPIIIGIGIDDGIHIVEKFLHRKGSSLASVISHCAKAVTLTSLTTILGFSSLFLAKYSGFRSLGLSAILGVFYCWLFSVVLLPLLMSVFRIDIKREDGP
jgi:predicted RND superfamily exporter protein